jgi:multisubunit Na+/H+ antiporter MnhB subunit
MSGRAAARLRKGLGRKALKRAANGNRRAIAGALLLSLVGALMLGMALQPGFSDFGNKAVANYYIGKGWQALKASNAVCSIVWDFRGYDTLGEETILFTAAIGIFTLGFGLHARHRVTKEVAGA